MSKLSEKIFRIKYRLKAINYKLIRFVFVLSIFFSIPVTVFLAQKGFFSVSKAAVSATFTLSPTTFLLPGDKTISLLLNTGVDKVGFAQAELIFDQTKVKIVSFNLGQKLTRSISVTDIASANQSGVFKLALGLEPGSYSSAPSGTFELARFTINSNTAAPNITSTISQDAGKSQVVALSAEKASISPATTTAIINPQVSCGNVRLVDTVITGASYDRFRMRLKNNSTQTVYLTGSKMTWSSTSSLKVDWFSWISNQYWAGDSSISPAIYDPVTVLTLAPGVTGAWIADFKNQPLGGIKGTFTGDLTVNFTCNFQGKITR